MFDVTPEEIALLNDVDLRALVARLCEAELISLGLSPVAVTWGGNQTASDGGLDVRVSLPATVSIEGFVPRFSTGFQVKKPDMPKGAIIKEMRPDGTIRPVIQELADEAGAYIIVSSAAATSDRALRDRNQGLRDALSDVSNADKLHTDFYDRTRLATWVRCFPGLIVWVKAKIGRGFSGWQPYGFWSGGVEGVNAEYLFDEKLRLHLGRHRDAANQPVAEAIDELRDELAQPGKVVRLVGLSGVGKTRLAQALFDARIGSRPLPGSQAIYTNLSDSPNPQPTGLASDLIATQTRAIVVVDNCPPDLHHRLSELCSGPGSTVSILTIEYDVRDDHPERTQVVTLDTSSIELIEKLILRRYAHLSQVDARTIAEVSGGNARIAIAIAETVERSDTIAGLSNEDLFQRLFVQRHSPDNALLVAAQALSLVYSFQGEALTGEAAELPRLASLAGQPVAEVYRHVRELLRRDLVQQRGVWRALLPHALANRLAARALEDMPYDLINEQLVDGGTERLALSFSRRLSFLHDHPGAATIAAMWLRPEGRLGDVRKLTGTERAMFMNVAPVLPEAALAALERAIEHQSEVMTGWEGYFSVLRSVAYDPPLFARSTRLLIHAATRGKNEEHAKEASKAFTSLFSIYLSGTYATASQRLEVIEHLLSSAEEKAHSLGLAALERALETMYFHSDYSFEFGARPRDHGYEPSGAEVTYWYDAALDLIERLTLPGGKIKVELGDLVARKLRGLWSETASHDALERLSRVSSSERFWFAGWAAAREAMQYDTPVLTPDAAKRLSALVDSLQPSNLAEQVRAWVLGDRSGRLDLEQDMDGDLTSSIERAEAEACEMGRLVAADHDLLNDLLPDLLQGGNRIWSFGRGMAIESSSRLLTWKKLVAGLEQVPEERRNVRVLGGFLAELWKHDEEAAQQLLDQAIDLPVLLPFLPGLHTAARLDERGANRLMHVLQAKQIPVASYRNLAFGRATDQLSGAVLAKLLALIADRPNGGFDVAVEILHMRLFSDESDKRVHEEEVLEAGRELLKRIAFEKGTQRDAYQLARVVRACLRTPETRALASHVASTLVQAMETHRTTWHNSADLLKALFKLQPKAVLDALAAVQVEPGVTMASIGWSYNHRGNPADAIPEAELVAWCNEDAASRYRFAASIITFAHRPDKSGSLVWTEQAKALLKQAPDPSSVLKAIVARFRPRSWKGSRASIIEANTQLLDDVGAYIPAELLPFVDEAKAQLAQEIAREREWETRHDQVRDERFE